MPNIKFFVLEYSHIIYFQAKWRISRIKIRDLKAQSLSGNLIEFRLEEKLKTFFISKNDQGNQIPHLHNFRRFTSIFSRIRKWGNPNLEKSEGKLMKDHAKISLKIGGELVGHDRFIKGKWKIAKILFIYIPLSLVESNWH